MFPKLQKCQHILYKDEYTVWTKPFSATKCQTVKDKGHPETDCYVPFTSRITSITALLTTSVSQLNVLPQWYYVPTWYNVSASICFHQRLICEQVLSFQNYSNWAKVIKFNKILISVLCECFQSYDQIDMLKSKIRRYFIISVSDKFSPFSCHKMWQTW